MATPDLDEFVAEARHSVGERVLGLPAGPRIDEDDPWNEIRR